MEIFILGVVGPMQIVLIILVLLLLFGGAKIPMLMKNLGKGINEFKKATKGDQDAEQEDKKDDTSAENK